MSLESELEGLGDYLKGFSKTESKKLKNYSVEIELPSLFGDYGGLLRSLAENGVQISNIESRLGEKEDERKIREISSGRARGSEGRYSIQIIEVAKEAGWWIFRHYVPRNELIRLDVHREGQKIDYNLKPLRAIKDYVELYRRSIAERR